MPTPFDAESIIFVSFALRKQSSRLIAFNSLALGNKEIGVSGRTIVLVALREKF